ncbi:MAG: crotonase/enoyl-CoA hydratase family protein [Pseudomonadota bacterium]
MPDTISISQDAAITTIRLNRAEKKNAMSLQMMQELIDAGRAVGADPSCRVVILTGEGDSFCAGLDLADLMKLGGDVGKTKEILDTPIDDTGANLFQLPCTIWRQLDVPVIAALSGNVLGAGAQLALGADYRIGARDVRFSILEAKWGLIPDMGITQILPGLLAADQAFELISTGRILDAEEASALGLVSKLADDPEAEAQVLAETLCASSPQALAAGKELIRKSWGSPDDGLALEAALQKSLIGTPNQMEKTMASMQKRAPHFKT